MTDEQFKQHMAEQVRIRKAIEALALHLGAGKQAANGGGQSSGSKPPLVASDSDLDGAHGDPQVKFNPKTWVDQGGEDFKGTRLSLCSAEFLDIYAEALQFSADNPNDKNAKYVDANRRDAARARGWAMRIRGQNVPVGDGNDDGGL